MIGATGRNWAWIQAALLSVTLHGAAAAALIYRPSWSVTAPPPLEQLQLEITTMNQGSTEVATPVLSSTASLESTEIQAKSETLAEPEQEVLAHLDDGQISPLLSDNALPMIQSNKPISPAGIEATGAPEAQAASGESGPIDPRLAELFDRIRSLLTEPCLLALPAMRGDDAIQLGVLAASDRKISSLMTDITEGLETEVTEAAVLLDQRQCPGLAFARQDPLYPVFGLGIQLESQQVASGASLQGQISGGTGRYNTLLLIDDNGVVHDLRRYLIRSANLVRFNAPVARSGAARDTHQLIVAIATPRRPETVSRLSGQFAKPFFEALRREVGDDAMVGVSSVYIR